MNHSPPGPPPGSIRTDEVAGSWFDSAGQDPFPMNEPLDMRPQEGAIVLRFLEAAPKVRRRYQFFVWTQSHLHSLMPHQVLVCGAYARQRRDLQYEAFYSVVLSPPLVQAFTLGGGELLRMAGSAWVTGQGRPLVLELNRFPGDAAQREAQMLRAEAQVDCLLVHGVARPQRPAEIETLFVLACRMTGSAGHWLRQFEMVLPYLHSTWQRVQAQERDMAPATPRQPAVPRPDVPTLRPLVTERERQILAWVREGKSNQQIGELLGISPLTVKNHVQKVLRKLTASNRAQAVAKAMAMNLLGSPGGGDREP